MWKNVASGPWFFNDQCNKTTVRGPMEAGKNSVIYTGLVPGPNKADIICGKTKVTGTMQRGSTVYICVCVCVCVCIKEFIQLLISSCVALSVKEV
jgi:hypothetical protein